MTRTQILSAASSAASTCIHRGTWVAFLLRVNGPYRVPFGSNLLWVQLLYRCLWLLYSELCIIVVYGFYINPNMLFHTETLKTEDKAPKLATVTIYLGKGSSGIRCYRSTKWDCSFTVHSLVSGVSWFCPPLHWLLSWKPEVLEVFCVAPV